METGEEKKCRREELSRSIRQENILLREFKKGIRAPELNQYYSLSVKAAGSTGEKCQLWKPAYSDAPFVMKITKKCCHSWRSILFILRFDLLSHVKEYDHLLQKTEWRSRFHQKGTFGLSWNLRDKMLP